MAPVPSKLLSTKHSPYVFSASMTAVEHRPTVINCFAPSSPRRVRGAQLTITRVFKTQSISLIRRKHASTLASQKARQSTAGPSSAAASAQRAGTPASSALADAEESIIESPLSSPPPSPPSTPTRTRARSPDDPQGSRRNTAPYSKPARLMRSASRSSGKGTKKSGSKTMAVIDARLKVLPDGELVTRYGEQDGQPIFIRQDRVTSTTEPDVVTYFWETFTAVPLRHPPDLSTYPDLAVGDIFCNRVRDESRTVQLWAWSIGDDGVGSWKRVREGDVREDGRRLTVTPKRQQPSWVSPNWGEKQLRGR